MTMVADGSGEALRVTPPWFLCYDVTGAVGGVGSLDYSQ